jgi:hypothetical protein
MVDRRQGPFVLAGVRLGSGLFAAIVVAVGFFGESFAYALAVGIAIGTGFAVVGHLRDRIDDERTDYP